MNWLIEEIKKRPGLMRWASASIYIIKKSYMFLINKICGIKNNKVVFISFSGKSYSDNPRAISEKLHELHPEFKIIWLFINPEEKRKISPNYIQCIKSGSFKALKELSTSKFWIDNFTKPIYTYKSKKQVYIQTWHGERGFKKILYDSPFVSSKDKYIENRICNLAVSGSEYGNMQYRSAFKYDGKILQEGCPRNDILLNNNKALVNKIKKSLNIEDITKVLLYAPTLRREAANKKSKQAIGNIDLNEVLSVLEKKTNEEWVCFVRAHSAVNGIAGIPKGEKFIDVSLYEDMNELLLISDILITDYSSSAGDFALVKRPIILFQNDREEYLKKDRTFYFDINKSPYMVVFNQDELIEIIKKLNINTIIKNCKEILDFYGTHETGKAAEAVVNYIISGIGGVN